ARPGHLRLSSVFVPGAKLAAAPNLLLQKLPARSFRVQTSVELSSAPGIVRAGLAVTGDDSAALAVETTAAGLSVALHVGDQVLERVELPRGPLRLFLDFAPDGACRFAFASGAEPARYMAGTFQAK